MTVQLQPELVEYLRLAQPGMLGVEMEGGRVDFVVKMPQADIETSRNTLAAITYLYGAMPSGPVMAMMLTLFAQAGEVAPWSMEAFFNVGADDDVALLQQLVTQEYLLFHFFNEDVAWQYTKQVRHREPFRDTLAALFERALGDWQQRRGDFDFAAAKFEYQARVAW